MESLTTIITIVGILLGGVVSWHALNSTSDLEQVFLTREQKIKLYILNLIVLSGIISILSTIFYILWNGMFKEKLEMDAVFLFGMAIFIICLISLGAIFRWIHNFAIKHQYKYKVNLPGVGEVYILSMMNSEVCVCSEVPYENNEIGDSNSFLIKLETLMDNPLIKEKFLKPKRSILQKLID